MKSDLVDITDIEFKFETAAAWKVVDSKGREIWLPKSQCERNEDGSIAMPEWLALEKGLI